MATEYRDAPDGNAGDNAIDPGEIARTAPAAPGTGERKKRKYTRRNGGSAAGATAGKSKVALDLSSLTGLFVGAHVLLADRTGVPELAITEDEGQQFMQRAQAVLRHYSVQTTQKAMDWIAFAGVAGMIYIPRVVALANRPSQRQSAPAPMQHHAAPAADAPPGSPIEQAYAMTMVQPEAAE